MDLQCVGNGSYLSKMENSLFCLSLSSIAYSDAQVQLEAVPFGELTGIRIARSPVTCISAKINK